MRISLEHIRQFLAFYQRQHQEAGTRTAAGVLMPLFEKDGELHLLLTRRTDRVEQHKGQVAFPGGARDAEDGDIVATALREAEEEIGLDPAAVEVLGMFDDMPTHTGFVITPVVGFLRTLPLLSPNRDEVDEIFDVPLGFFQDKQNEAVKQLEREGVMWDVYFYRYGTHDVWGITAAIIRSFLLGLSAYGQKKAL